MAIEKMKTESETVYEVLEDGVGVERVWRPISKAAPDQGWKREVAGMFASSHPVGTLMRVKVTTIAAIEKPKKPTKTKAAP